MAHRVSISVLAQLVRAACRPLSEFASKYRATSFTFLAWLLALETYKFANMYSGPHSAGPESTIKGYDSNGTNSSSRLDPAKDGQDKGSSIAGSDREQHAKVDDGQLDRPHANADLNNHPATAVGSSTDPRILSESFSSNPTIGATGVSASADLGSGIKGNGAGTSGTLANQTAVLQVVVNTTAPTPAVPAPTVSSVVASGSGIDGSGNGDLNAGHVVTLTVNMSEAVTVAGGVPTLSLNNGATASYSGGSSSNALTFSYTVGAGEDTSDLAVTSFNLNGATVNDAAGNSANIAGAVTNPPGILQIDTTAPAAPTVALANDTGSSSSNSITSNGSLAVTPAEAGGTIQYSTNGGASWTGSFTAVAGVNNVEVRQIDAAGNNGAAASFSFTLDTTAPAAPTVALANDTGSSSSNSITSNGSLAVTPAEAGGTIQYSTNGGASWTGSFTAVAGVNNVEVRQIDAAGNNGAAASFSFTLDTTAPAAPTVALANDTGSSSSDSITSNGSLAVTPAEAGGTIQYSTNGGASWTGSFTAVAGVNNVEVRQIDAAGNNGAAASFSFTLDTTAPAAPTVALANDTGSSSSDSITSNGSLAVTPAEAGGTIQYSTNGGASWTGSFTAVAGVNNVEVRQIDAAGNNGAAASFSFTLDTTAPAAPTVALANDTGSSSSDSITSNGSLAVTPAEAGGTIQYSTNGGASWTGSFTAVAGVNNVEVRQIDAAGNNGTAASFSFTLDTTAPAAPTVALAHDTAARTPTPSPATVR